MRKANLSLNTIVIAALALIVLIVLVLIFTGKVRVFRDNTIPTCSEQGGKCLASAFGADGVCDGDYPLKMYTRGCTPEGLYTDDKEKRGPCCLPVR